MHQCYLSLGSNLGDSAANLKSAIELLSNNFALDVVAVSEIIKTKPYGHITSQNDFYNVCVSIRTWYCPFSLLHICLSVEIALGRKRELRWGPRTLDIDILLYDDLVLKTNHLVLPHYDMDNRAFVLEPLKQIYERDFANSNYALEV